MASFNLPVELQFVKSVLAKMRVTFSYLVQKGESVLVYTKEVYHIGVGWVIPVEVNNT